MGVGVVELRGCWLQVRKKLWSGGGGLGLKRDPSGGLHL